MKTKGKTTILLLGFFFSISYTSVAIQLKSKIQNSRKAYGNSHGLVIDFDSTTPIQAYITKPLIQGATYSIRSLSLRIDPKNKDFLFTTRAYIAVYSSLTESEKLSGFLGISDAPVMIPKNSRARFYTWSFSGITVTPEANPGEGKDCLYFIFQKNKIPLTELTDLNLPLSRSETSFENTFSTIIRSAFRKTILKNRTPNYKVTLSLSSMPKKDPAPPLLKTTAISSAPKTSTPTVPKKKKIAHPSTLIAFTVLILLLFRKKQNKETAS